MTLYMLEKGYEETPELVLPYEVAKAMLERIRGIEMTDNKIIHNLIEEELAEANKQHPLFHSPHETYAVLLEEVEEAEDELVQIKMLLAEMWTRIRQDCGVEDVLHRIKGCSVYGTGEFIQVGAMAEKALDSLYKN